MIEPIGWRVALHHRGRQAQRRRDAEAVVALLEVERAAPQCRRVNGWFRRLEQLDNID